MIKILRNTIIWNILFWTIGYVILFLIVFIQGDIQIAFNIATLIIVPAPLPIYVHFYFLDNYFKKRKYFIYFIATITIVALSGYLIEILFDILFTEPNSHISGVLVSLILIVIATAVRYSRKQLYSQYLLQEAEYKQLETEMNLLKSQINPHFFFNTLNNLYSLSLNNSEEVPDVILKLSELMRYVIDSQKKKWVNIDEEVRFIDNYIALESLRFKTPSVIEYKKNISFTDQHIAPMLLIPFIENAFKHGLSTMIDKGFLKINIDSTQKEVYLKVVNSIQQEIPNENSIGGLGLKNVKRRLEILYPDKHKLEIRDLFDRFEIELRIFLL